MAGPPRREDPDNTVESDFEQYFAQDTEEQRRPATPGRPSKKSASSGGEKPNAGDSADPSLDQVVDTLFMKSFKVPRSASSVTSGDADTDRAIDLAVNTLFVEEPETAAPETAEVEAQVVQSLDTEIETMASRVAMKERRLRHPPDLTSFAPKEPRQAIPPPDVETEPRVPATASLVKLQEAILTLEWEISERSVKTLAKELQVLRQGSRDDVTIDFAALAMKVVLNYVVKRMSRAHPESIRFLLDVTSFIRVSLTSPNHDPLVSFHQILTRYERYKSVVRRAEGIPDATAPILDQLQIHDPDAFSALVQHQTSTLSRAARSLATKIPSVDDPENLIRSFRFLATRAFNRILESTVRAKPLRPRKKGGTPR